MMGTLADVLEHFERDCSFHEAICGRCEARVVQSDIAVHLRHGCTGNSEPATRTTQGDSSASSRQQRHLNLDDFEDAVAELKIVLTTNGSNVLSVLETKANELTENMRSIEAMALELVETSKKDGTELRQQLGRVQSELASWRNSLRGQGGSFRTKTRDAFTSATISTRTMRTQTDTPVVLQSEATQKRKCKESAASLDMAPGTRSYGGEASGGAGVISKADGREPGSAKQRPATGMRAFPQLLCNTSSTSIEAELPSKGPARQNSAGNSAVTFQRGTQAAHEAASFITHVEAKYTGRSEHCLVFTGWESFRTKAAGTGQHVYATCTVWYSEESWFRILLFLETLEGNVLHLTAYVKLHGAGAEMAAVQGRKLPSTPWGTLEIVHPSKSGRAISGNPMNGWRPVGFEHHSNIKSQHYMQFISVPADKLAKEGYVGHDTIHFHFALERV